MNIPQISWERNQIRARKGKKTKKQPTENGDVKLKTTVISIKSIKSAWNSTQFNMVVWSVYQI